MAGYVNLSTTFIYNSERYIHRNWAWAWNDNFFHEHILARGACLSLTPVSVIIHALDIIAGLGAGVATVVTLGMDGSIAHSASCHLKSSNYIISNPYRNLLKTINPKAIIELEGAPNPGLFAADARSVLGNLAADFKMSDHLLLKHVASRLTFALTGLAVIITRVVDAILGMIALPLSFPTLGLVDDFNSVAYAGLQAPGVVNDLFYCMIRTINPWAAVRS